MANVKYVNSKIGIWFVQKHMIECTIKENGATKLNETCKKGKLCN